MGLFGSFLGKKTSQVRVAASVAINRNLMEAAVFGALYVAAGDGNIGQSEMDAMDQILANNPQLKGFGSELTNTIDRAKADFKSGHRILRQSAEKELTDLAHSPTEALTVLNIMLTVAESSADEGDENKISAVEMAILEKAAKLMGLNLKDHL